MPRKNFTGPPGFSLLSHLLDSSQVLTSEDLVAGEEVFFIATGVTDGTLMSGVRYRGDRAQTESIVLRGKTKTRRGIITEHVIE